MPLWLSALIVAVPTFLYARLIVGIDRFEREPTRYVVAAFVWGAIPAALFALILQLALSIPTTIALGEEGTNALATAVYAPVTEEVVKGLAVALIYLWRRREFDGWVDGIVYGSSVGFGFAFTENILYLSTTESLDTWLQLFVLRVIVLGFMHGFYTSLTGIGFGVARHAATTPRKFVAIATGLGAAILVHAIHNTAILFGEASEAATLLVALLNYLLLIGLMIALRLMSRRNERQMFRTYLVDEAPDVITPQAYAALSDAKAQSQSLPSPKAAFYQLAGELAQRKRQLVKYGETTQRDEVDQLRAKLRAMSDSARS